MGKPYIEIQLERIKANDLTSVVITDDNGNKTNSFNLNIDSATELIKWLTNTYLGGVEQPITMMGQITMDDYFDRITQNYADGNYSKAKELYEGLSEEQQVDYEDHFSELHHYEALDNDTEVNIEFIAMMVKLKNIQK